MPSGESTVPLLGCAGGGRRSGWADTLEELTTAADVQMQQRDNSGAASQEGEHCGGGRAVQWRGMPPEVDCVDARQQTSTDARESHCAAQGAVEQVPARAEGGPTNSNPSRK